MVKYSCGDKHSLSKRYMFYAQDNTVFKLYSKLLFFNQDKELTESCWLLSIFLVAGDKLGTNTTNK